MGLRLIGRPVFWLEMEVKGKKVDSIRGDFNDAFLTLPASLFDVHLFIFYSYICWHWCNFTKIRNNISTKNFKSFFRYTVLCTNVLQYSNWDICTTVITLIINWNIRSNFIETEWCLPLDISTFGWWNWPFRCSLVRRFKGL